MVENGARFGGSTKRMALLKEHRAYQAETIPPTSPTYIRKISAGPLVRYCNCFAVAISSTIIHILIPSISSLYERNPMMGSSWLARRLS